MKTIAVSASKKYDVVVGPGLMDEAGARAKKLAGGSAAAVVTDDTVGPLYTERLSRSLLESGFRVACFSIPSGEASKNAGNYIALLNFLARERFTRSDTVFALGGGVIGDLAGFAASTYMRGMRLVQLPTTLLSAVDSSVGGKTAIDLEAGKNLAGTFFQPDLVLCDTDTLKTLPDDIFWDGHAEVVKYGVIADGDLFYSLETPCGKSLEEIIARCVAVKRDIVEQDETENGPRKLLNLGHTVGHAVETLSGYTVSHGKAVAIGMSVIARAASKKGVCSQELPRRLVGLLDRLGLPTSTDFSAAQLFEAALNDKKRGGSTITLVLPETIGRCVLWETPVAELEEFIALGL